MRAVAVLLVTGLLLPVSLAFTTVAGRPVGAANDAATTVAGVGRFAALQVTVSQTRNLINQVVSVSWQGGTPTVPSSGTFATHYLQIMQCWGDDVGGPRREQCQYGGRLGDPRGGGQSSTRQVTYGATLVDVLETYKPPPGSLVNEFVPFESVTGKTTAGGRSEFFDATTTNEIAYGRTRGDGTGEEFFEMHTGAEAPGLGCGQVQGAGAERRGRPCWLVVVPRNDLEVDGARRSGSGAFRLDSSPLSASNWAQRLVFPLGFEPAGDPCPFGKERPVLGHEAAVEAVSRWQPALCVGGGTSYAYSQVPDPVARRQLAGDAPGLVLTSTGIAAETLPPGRRVRYAPLTLSGLTVSFLVEKQFNGLAADELLPTTGQRVTQMKLTPRLVAKLLTQSYGDALPKGATSVEGNPRTLTSDPDFTAINPEFEYLLYNTTSDLLVPVGQSGTVRHLWEWIDADPEARAFLDGAADPHGMIVNPTYRRLELPVSDFPKSDPHCQAAQDDQLPLCALERRPYAGDLHEGARAAARGDSLARQTWDPLSSPPSWKKSELQPGGSRAVLAVVDTPTALRFGLQIAALRNHAGAFVTPDVAGLEAALGDMTARDASGVLEPDPESTSLAAYPLPILNYGATVPAALDRVAGEEYAAFLEYAVGDGQVPGISVGALPAGYVPLPAALREKTRDVAAAIRREAGVPAAPGPSTAPTAAAPAATAQAPPAAAPAEVTGGSAILPRVIDAVGRSTTAVTGPLPLPPVVRAAPATAAPVDLLIQPRAATPGEAVGASRFAVLMALLVGVAAVVCGPAFTPARRSRTRG